MLGTIIDGEYEIKELIGKGAFGSVYRARQLRLERDVAVKVHNAEDAGPKELERFLSEARLLAALNHVNVVQIYALGRYQEKPYLVMELLTGETLKEVLESPPVPVQRALKIMLQVARGLQAIHALGVVHRDLSTNNVIVGAQSVKILDLGLAKDLTRISQDTQDQYIVGTVGYISPEQVESKSVSMSSDIFAFGVILYEILAGAHPFKAEHYMSMLYNIVHGDPPPLTSYVRNLPPTLVDLVGQCLQKKAADRPHGMQAVEKVLGDVLASTPFEDTIERLGGISATASRGSRNPYLNRVMIRRGSDFFGRNQDVNRIYARLNATPPGSVSVVGDRKIGKSSLLNFIYMRQNRQEYLDHPDKMIMVFMDLQQHKDMGIESFVRVLLTLANLELRGRVDVSDCSHNLDGIRVMVERMDGAGLRLAILLDQFELITGNKNFGLEFFSFLRFLANHFNVAYLTSSARDLQSLCHDEQISDSPFFNIFSTMRLQVFKRDEALALIRKPSAEIGRPLEPYFEEILGMAGLFPFLLQMACSHALEYLEEVDKVADFQEIRRRFYEEARFFYRHMWDGFDPYQRSLLRRVAGHKGIPDSLSHVLEELANRNYVSMESSGTKLFASTFEHFVKTETTERKPLLKRLFGSAGS